MGGLYRHKWSCSNCSYKESTIAAPMIIKPIEGIPESEIEHRWCFDCEGIRNVFTGKGKEYEFGNDPISNYINKNIDQLYKSKKRLHDEISSLKHKTLVIGKKKKLLRLEVSLLKINEEIKAYKLATLTQEFFNWRSQEFYDKFKPKARCIHCNSTNVSELKWNEDKHSCRGDFKKDNYDKSYNKAEGTIRTNWVYITAIEYDEFIYDQYGITTHEMKPHL